MPIPTPNDGETQDDFVSRCMANDTMNDDYPDNDQRAAVCYSQWRDERAAHMEQKMSSRSERLRELRRRKADTLAKMGEIVRKEEDAPEGESVPEAGSAFDQLRQVLTDLDGQISRVEAWLEAERQSAENNGDDDEEKPDETAGLATVMGKGFRDRLPAQPKKTPKQGPGYHATRFAYGVVWARFHHAPMEKAAEFISNRFGDDVVARALNTIATGEGGALIPQDFMADLIELLRSTTAVRRAGPMEVGMPMGNLTIPRLAGGATAAYQGELDDITVSQERFDDVNLVAKKLACIVPISNDLIRRAPIGVEEIVRDDLVQTLARREDLAFLRGDGTDKGPVGMKNIALAANKILVGAMPATPQPGDQLTAILGASSTAILALQNGMSRMIKPAWIMAPTIARFIATARDQIGGFYYKDEIAAGRFEGYPIFLTQQIPTNLVNGTNTKGSEIYFVDMADFIIADTYNMVVDASDVASYNDGTGMVSSFQRDQSVFRVISEHDVNMRHLQSLVVLLTQDWAFSGLPGAAGAPFSTQPLNPTWSQAPAIRPAVSTGANPPPTLSDPH